ncbi:hypothetical protein K525DRAFT_264517 [Schizophyllum commune Loenen D]|nr:hypothetical protein K525DRAFT_264517 [Schizophyllum commune Loenen D]
MHDVFITPRDVLFIFHIVRKCVINNFDYIMESVAPRRNAQVAVDLREAPLKLSVHHWACACGDLEADPTKARLRAEALIDYPWWPKSIAFEFLPKGSEHPPFTPLTFGYLNSWNRYDRRQAARAAQAVQEREGETSDSNSCASGSTGSKEYHEGEVCAILQARTDTESSQALERRLVTSMS